METATNAQLRGYVLQEDDIMKRSIDLAFLAAIAITSVAIPVLATASPITAAVQYRNADLATPAAVARLHSRIEWAAREVCLQFDGRDLARQQVFKNCYKQAVAGGVIGVHSPALNAFHEARTGEHLGNTEVAMKLASKALPSGVRIR
jgi:UrcA family protein